MLEARNAINAYDQIGRWQPTNEKHLLKAHLTLMQGLIDESGRYRSGGVGVMAGSEVIHMAPGAKKVPSLMADLLNWLKITDAQALVASSVFHYEFEFIHPFADGNGRVGRLWQTLILSRWNSLFINIPVESLVHQNQQRYYKAIQTSTEQSDCAVFIEFMLEMILDAIGDHSGSQTTQKTNHKTTQKQQAILDYLMRNPNASRAALARAIEGITESGVKYNLKVLQDAGLLMRVGSAKSGHWQVRKP